MPTSTAPIPSPLVDFILARLDEDEQVAQAALTTEVNLIGHGDTAYDEAVALADNEGAHRAGLAHLGRHTPARVLAEATAKRVIVDAHSSQGERGPAWDYACAEQGMGWASPDDCPELRALASVYADHPDYRTDWRP